LNIEELKDKVFRNPQTPLFARLAGEYLNSGNVAAAKELCLSGLERYPEYSTAHLVLAGCHAAENNLAFALESIRKARSFIPNSRMLAEFQERLENLSAAPPGPAGTSETITPEIEPESEQDLSAQTFPEYPASEGAMPVGEIQTETAIDSLQGEVISPIPDLQTKIEQPAREETEISEAPESKIEAQMEVPEDFQMSAIADISESGPETEQPILSGQEEAAGGGEPLEEVQTEDLTEDFQMSVIMGGYPAETGQPAITEQAEAIQPDETVKEVQTEAFTDFQEAGVTEITGPEPQGEQPSSGQEEAAGVVAPREDAPSTADESHVAVPAQVEPNTESDGEVVTITGYYTEEIREEIPEDSFGEAGISEKPQNAADAEPHGEPPESQDESRQGENISPSLAAGQPDSTVSAPESGAVEVAGMPPQTAADKIAGETAPREIGDEGRIVSRTLAEIYAQQGEFAEAIITYRLLKRSRPNESEEIEKRIRELEDRHRSKLAGQ